MEAKPQLVDIFVERLWHCHVLSPIRDIKQWSYVIEMYLAWFRMGFVKCCDPACMFAFIKA